MQGVHVCSEIQTLKKVLLHRPGKELLYLTPNRLEELLFDDIPFLRVAQEEHDTFAKLLKENGVEVVYLEDLMVEALKVHPEQLKPFIYEWLEEGEVQTKLWQDTIYDYLTSNFKDKDLILKTMEGITMKEMGDVSNYSLHDRIAPQDDLIIDPMPNLYFQRDPFSVVGDGVLIHHMHFPTRRRETIYAEYIFKYHPEYENVPHYFERTFQSDIEGGDVFNLSEKVLAIGISQRTKPDAIEMVARNLFNDPNSTIETVLAFKIPSIRAFMHLDTVFTRIDIDKYTYHPAILEHLEVYALTPKEKEDGTFEATILPLELSLEEILEKYTGISPIQLIPCGGGDDITAAREQWNDGSNTLAIAPGKLIVYERNDVTNQILKESGVTTIEMPSAELSRGRGGPRCMTMPLIRE